MFKVVSFQKMTNLESLVSKLNVEIHSNDEACVTSLTLLPHSGRQVKLTWSFADDEVGFKLGSLA